jgi:predicted nucleotidyltransferase
MIADISLHREELRELCGRFHVRRLDLFGSAAGENFDPARSDLDFLVEFGPVPPGAYADAFFGLKESLEQLFGRPVDLVVAAAIRNPYFRESVEDARVQVYAARGEEISL